MTEPDPTPRPLDHLLCGGDPHAPALVNKAKTLTRGEAEAAVGALAAALVSKGLEPGARVATWLPKTTEACLMPLAAVRAGMVHVPINPVLRRGQVAYILADADAALLLTSAERAATLEAGDLPSGCALWLEAEAIEARHGKECMPPSDAAPDALAALLYTSGSTGQPKGVMVSHANLWLGAVSVAHFLQLRAGDVVLALLPLGFDYGQNQLLSTWYASASVVPFDYLMPRDVMKAVTRFGVTTLAAVPPLWLQLLEQDWGNAGRSIRRVTNSGGALTPPTIAMMRTAFPSADIYPMYGITEAFRSTYLNPALVDTHPTSMGRAIPFAEVMVLRPDGSEAAAGEAGELVHAGPLVSQGYWRDPERMRERYRPAPPFSRYGGIACYSGDTVMRDEEGLHYFLGRADETIKVSGHRVSPQEIEDAAISSGVVSEAVAHGVPDARQGQAIRLVVAGLGNDERLRTYLKRELPSHMQPSVIDWREALPRNANGKFDRSAIKAEVAP